MPDLRIMAPVTFQKDFRVEVLLSIYDLVNTINERIGVEIPEVAPVPPKAFRAMQPATLITQGKDELGSWISRVKFLV